MFRTLSRRFRFGNTVGFLLIQNENAANSQGGVLTRLRVEGGRCTGVLDSMLPCVAPSRRQSRNYHHSALSNSRTPKLANTPPCAHTPLRLAGCSVLCTHTPLHRASCTSPCTQTLYSLVTTHRLYSTTPPGGESKQSAQPNMTKPDDKPEGLEEKKEEEDEKSKGVLQRFKDAYKKYGKALVGVHVATSVCWFGTFYYAAANGLDVIPLLEYIGAGEKVIQTFQLPGVGNSAVAYLCYKIATPVRYTVTIVGTQLTVRQMRRWGYWEPPKPEDSLRSLMRESRESVKDRIDDVRDDVKDKFTDMRGDIKDRYSEVRGDFKDKYSDWKDKKMEDVKDWKDKRGQGIKERVSDFAEQVKDMNEEYKKKVENRPFRQKDDK